MNTTQEWVLVEKARSGDPGAFGELVNQHHRDVYRTVYSRMLSREDAEDITQETFIKALTSLHQLGSPHKFKQWIRRIAITFIRESILILPRECRLPVILRCFDGLSTEEVSNELGVSPASIESMLQQSGIDLGEVADVLGHVRAPASLVRCLLELVAESS